MKRRISGFLAVFLFCNLLLTACSGGTGVVIQPVQVETLEGSEQVKGIAQDMTSAIGTSIISTVGGFFEVGFMGQLGFSLLENIFGAIFSADDSSDKMMQALEEIQAQIEDLSYKIDNQTLEIKKAINDSEISTDMRKINEKYAAVDRLYDDYESIMKIVDQKVRNRELDTFFNQTVPAAKLRDVITYAGSYLTKSSSGSRSLCTLYVESCRATYPFEHQIAEGVNAFYQYHISNIQRALLLYSKSCEYKAENKSKASDPMVLEAKRALGDVQKIYSYMKAQLDVAQMTTKIDYTGTDGVGNTVAFYLVRLNADQKRYVVVDKAYNYQNFYNRTPFKRSNPRGDSYLSSVRASTYNAIMYNLPKCDDPAVPTEGVVMDTPQVADAFFKAAPSNDIMGYLKNNGIPMGSYSGSSTMAFPFAEAVRKTGKTFIQDFAIPTFGGQFKWGRSPGDEGSDAMRYFLSSVDSNAFAKAEKKVRIYVMNMASSQDFRMSTGNQQKLVEMVYCHEEHNGIFDYPMYLVYQVNDDLEKPNINGGTSGNEGPGNSDMPTN